MRLATDVRNAAVDGAVGRLDAGTGPATIKVYTGPQPATPATPPTGTLLLTFTLNDPAFAAASGGSAALSTTPALTTLGVGAGAAGWFRAADSDGNAKLDGAVGTSNADLVLSTTTVSVGLSVTVTSGSYAQPSG